MKLVDKSEIIKEAWRVEYKDMFHMTVSEDVVSINDIEKAPEVEAIPIEFIKKYYEGITMPFTDTRIQFEELIRKWEAEK